MRKIEATGGNAKSLMAKSCEAFGFGDHVLKVAAIFAFRELSGERLQLRERKEPLPKRGLFRAANLYALPFLDRLDVRRGFMEAAARARVEPGKTAAETMHVQLAPAQIFDIDVGYFQFATRRRFQILRDGNDIVIVDVKSRNGVVAFWTLRLFFDGDRAAVTVELDDAIALGVVNMITEYCRATFELCESLKKILAPVKNVVTKD